ncbi:hypothetical protein [Streptomyces capitiformicae]|uniref:Dioxygenase n=1 Tax=Streptomyces capitiformicae TaxID=2014920 RepID=A0A919L4V1_9ACTN|nr:hypothetical protein GCM10017771_07920 [Streptomyces capitiformicae]
MTGNQAKHKSKTITRRRALAVTGGTVAAGATATASATSSSSSECMTLMTSVTEGPYYLDGALVRKDITEGKSGVPLTLRLTVVDATDGCTPVPGAAVEIWHCDARGLLLRPHHREPRRLGPGRERGSSRRSSPVGTPRAPATST